MSYTRFGDDSDVYVFWNGNFMVCCACSLLGNIESAFLTPTGMLGHLMEHIDAGDKVPVDVIPAIENDIFNGGLEVEQS